LKGYFENPECPCGGLCSYGHRLFLQSEVIENAQPSGERQLPLAANAGTILRWRVRPDDGKHSGR